MSNPFDPAGELPADTNPFEPRTQRELDVDLYETWATNQQSMQLGRTDGKATAQAPIKHACPKCGRLHAPWCAPHGGQAESVQLEPIAPQRATIAPVTNRADSIRVIAACEAVAKALREQLTGEASAEWEGNGTRASYDVPGIGKLVASIDQAGVTVGDREAWMKYARRRWPEEVVMVPAFRNPAFEKTAREAFEKLIELVDDDAKGEILTARAEGRVLDDELTTVPGLKWVEGGTFRSASLTVDSKLKRHVADVARKYVAGAGPLEIEGGH